jgi:hypothetical protein
VRPAAGQLTSPPPNTNVVLVLRAQGHAQPDSAAVSTLCRNMPVPPLASARRMPSTPPPPWSWASLTLAAALWISIPASVTGALQPPTPSGRTLHSPTRSLPPSLPKALHSACGRCQCKNKKISEKNHEKLHSINKRMTQKCLTSHDVTPRHLERPRQMKITCFFVFRLV